MRWDNLFDDLESQLEQGLSAEDVDLRAEEERLRLGRLSVRDRLVAVHDSYEKRAEYSLAVALSTGDVVPLRPATIGRDWVSGDIRDGSNAQRQCIIPIAAIAGITLSKDQVRRSLSAAAPGTGPSVAARLGIPFVLRDLCRRRVTVEAVVLDGTVTGTIDRVGRDHLDIAVHEPGEPRRESAVFQYRVVPFDRIAMIRL